MYEDFTFTKIELQGQVYQLAEVSSDGHKVYLSSLIATGFNAGQFVNFLSDSSVEIL